MDNKRIMVVGGANMDVVLSLDRMPSAGESLISNSQKYIPGGKGANRAVALKRLGINPLFSCNLGDDFFGDALFNLYVAEGMDTSLVCRASDSSSGIAYILLESNGQNRIVVHPGANALYSQKNIDDAVKCFPHTSILSIELETPIECVEKLNYAATKSGVLSIIDAGPIKPLDPKIFKGAFILSPNESEAEAITGIPVSDEKSIAEACKALYSYGVKYALIKLGSNGSVCYDGHDFIRVPAFSTGEPVVDTTAAGDSYMSGLCVALTNGLGIEKAMRYASVVAGISVTRFGAVSSLPYNNEVDNLIKQFSDKAGL